MYKLVIEFSNFEDLKNKLKQLLNEIERVYPSVEERKEQLISEKKVMPREIEVLCDQTVTKLGELLIRELSIRANEFKEKGIDLKFKVYEVDSNAVEEYEFEGVRYLPLKDDFDILKFAYGRKDKIIVITGDKKLAQTCKVYGIKVIYKPPAGVRSREDYAMRVVEDLLNLLKEMFESP